MKAALTMAMALTLLVTPGHRALAEDLIAEPCPPVCPLPPGSNGKTRAVAAVQQQQDVLVLQQAMERQQQLESVIGNVLKAHSEQESQVVSHLKAD